MSDDNTASSIFDEPGSTSVDDEAAYQAALAGSSEEPTPADDLGGDDKGAAAQPAQATQAAEEQAGQTAPESEEKPPKGYVRHEALHETRMINSELRQELAEMHARLAQFSGLREELNEWKASRNQQSAAEKEAAEKEAYDNDPVGFMKAKTDAMEAELNRLQNEGKLTEKQREQAEAQQRALQELTVKITTQVNEFRQVTPDYQDAFKFLFDARVKEYEALGITDPVQVQQAFNQESYALAQAAMANKRNPGEAVYALAKARGYTRKEPDTATDKAADDGKKDTLTQQLDKLEKGQQAAQTLSGGGSRATGDVTLADIERMTPAEEDAFFERMARANGEGSFLDE